MRYRLTDFTAFIRHGFTALAIGLLLGMSIVPALSERATAAPQKYSDRIVHVKLREGAALSFNGSTFQGAAAKTLYQKLGTRPTVQKRLFGSQASLDAQYQSLRASGNDVARLSQYIAIDLGKRANTAAVAAALKQMPEIAEAYPKPLPAPSPTTPSLTLQQGYRAKAPKGTGAAHMRTWPGALATGVKIVDVEYSWNTNHEDLAKARAAGATITVNTPADPFNDNRHGTAVLGILNAQDNGFGVTGMAPGATLGMANAYSVENGWDPAGAIYAASMGMKSGDVLVIEQQAWGPSSDANAYVPIEWYPEVYDAIRYATAKNIMVIEAGGNGSQNLNNAQLYGSPFPMGKPNSGAFIVGAGAACADGTPARSRMYFSNYGTRFDLQGWGNCVVTTGWDTDAFDGGPNASYTASFSGTSAATPVVAGAVAAYVGAYKKLNGATPTIAQVKSALKSTGTPQATGSGALTGNIGAQPNLARALLLTDKKAPSAPTGLKAKLSTKNRPVLTWTAAKDNVGVTGYKIYRNNTLIKTIPAGTTYTDTTTKGKKTYTYKIRATDASGHLSAYSNTITIKTK